MISQVESFLCPDKQGTPEEGRRIQRPKCGEKNPIKMKSPKTFTDKMNLVSIESSIILLEYS